ncbi:hypothetical protein IAT38_008148 [Cryptococcus sp. DSM 104549]
MAYEQYSESSLEDMESYMDKQVLEASMSDYSSMASPAPDGTLSPSMLFSPGSGDDHFAGGLAPSDTQSPYAPSNGFSSSFYGMQLHQTFSPQSGGVGTPMSGSSGFYGGSPAYSASVASPPPAPTHHAPPSIPSTSSRDRADPRAFAPQNIIDNAWGNLMSDLSRVPRVSVANLQPLQPPPLLDSKLDLAFDPNRQLTDSEIAAMEAQLQGVPAADPNQTKSLDLYLNRNQCSQQDAGNCPPDWDSCQSCSYEGLQCTLSNGALSKYTARKDEREFGRTPWWKEEGKKVSQQTVRKEFPTCNRCSRRGVKCEFKGLSLPSEARVR